MPSGGDLLDDHTTPGYSRSTADHWQASDSHGELLKIVDIVGRHYGPPLPMRYDDDDDDDMYKNAENSCGLNSLGPVAPISVNCTVSWLTHFTLLLLADVARDLSHCYN